MRVRPFFFFFSFRAPISAPSENSVFRHLFVEIYFEFLFSLRAPISAPSEHSVFRHLFVEIYFEFFFSLRAPIPAPSEHSVFRHLFVEINFDFFLVCVLLYLHHQNILCLGTCLLRFILKSFFPNTPLTFSNYDFSL
jgi:hypothetical protein